MTFLFSSFPGLIFFPKTSVFSRHWFFGFLPSPVDPAIPCSGENDAIPDAMPHSHVR